VQGGRVAASSPGRHLLALIADALELPEPAATPADRAAYLALVDRRAGLVLRACRQALDGPGDGGLLSAAGALFSDVACPPPVMRMPAPVRERPHERRDWRAGA
jgi:hypothetical protein